MRRSALLVVAALLATAPPPVRSDGAPPATPSAAQPDPAALRRAWPGDEGTIALASGATLVGRVVAMAPDGDVVELTSGARLKFPPGSILGLANPLPPVPAADRDEEVLLADGRVIRGVVVAHDDTTLTIRDRRSGDTRLPLADVLDRRPSPRWGFGEAVADPARGRLLATPTALRLERGEVAVAIAGFVQPSVTVGVLPGVQLRASGVVPSLYAGDDAFSGALAVQAGFSPLRRLHLAGGVTGSLERSGGAAFLFGLATLGTPNGHVTVYAGPPAVSAAHVGVLSDTVLAAGGALRLHRFGGIVGEQWLARREGEARMVSSLAGRAFLGGWALDLGLLVAYGDGPTDTAPWLGVSFTGVPSRFF
jgi:hypothetical protein